MKALPDKRCGQMTKGAAPLVQSIDGIRRKSYGQGNKVSLGIAHFLCNGKPGHPATQVSSSQTGTHDA
jgi:hypothetical protein